MLDITITIRTFTVILTLTIMAGNVDLQWVTSKWQEWNVGYTPMPGILI